MTRRPVPSAGLLASRAVVGGGAVTPRQPDASSSQSGSLAGLRSGVLVLSAVLAGRPRGAARARAGRGKVYTSERHRTWQGDARAVLASAWGGRAPTLRLVRLVLTVLHARPQRYRGPERRAPIGRKPDVDNVAKLVMDALTRGGVLHDDDQVWSLHVERYRCAVGEAEGVVVELYEEVSDGST